MIDTTLGRVLDDAISDPYDTVDEAKKSMVEEITQSKCHHDKGYKLADPTQTFYDGHEYVDFVCVELWCNRLW